MENHNWKKLALMGITSGIMVSHSLAAANAMPSSTSSTANSTDKAATDKTAKKSDVKPYDPNDGNMNYHLMTEDELLLELDANGAKLFKSLSPEGKALALKVASAMCNNTNPCSGLGACQTDEHDCAGKNKCAGKGKCSISNKNLAVKLVYDKMMAEKRAKANSPTK